MIAHIVIAVRNGGSRRVGLTGTMASPSQTNEACGAVGRGRDTFDLAPATLRAAMRAFSELTPMGVHTSSSLRVPLQVCTSETDRLCSPAAEERAEEVYLEAG